MTRSVKFDRDMAVALYLGEDYGQVDARRYQRTRCACPVYAVENDYITATSSPSKVPPPGEDRGGMNAFNWRLVAPPMPLPHGWAIWEHHEEQPDET